MDKINPEDTIRDLEMVIKKTQHELDRTTYILNETVISNNFIIRKLHDEICRLQREVDTLKKFDLLQSYHDKTTSL